MPDIKWIKITTEMFDDEKIRILEGMPEADTLIVIWIRLICMAGKVNAGGQIFLSPDLPYNEVQLASVFNRPLQTVRLAMVTFQKLGMIEITENGAILLPNFEKHQNIEGMEKVREATRLRVKAFRGREKVKLLPEHENIMRSSETESESHAQNFTHKSTLPFVIAPEENGQKDSLCKDVDEKSCLVTDGSVTVTQQSRIEQSRIEQSRIEGEGKGEEPSSSTTAPYLQIYNKLVESYEYEWGHYLPGVGSVVKKKINRKQQAQLRDLAIELKEANVDFNTIEEAFKEVGQQGESKFKVSYVRAVILAWIGNTQKKKKPLLV